MPKIPRATNRVLPRGGDQSNISAAAAPGQAIASLGADVQNVVTGHLIKQKRMRQARQLSEGRADFAKIFREEEDAIKRTDRHDLWSTTFNESATKRTEDYIKLHIDDEEVATALLTHSQGQIANSSNRLITEATNAEIDLSRASLTSSTKKNIDLAISDRKNAAVHMGAIKESIDEAVNQRIISATSGEKIKQAAQTTVIDGQVDNDIQANPWKALKWLKGKAAYPGIGERRKTYWKKVAGNEIKRRNAEIKRRKAEFSGIELVKTSLRLGLTLDHKNPDHKKAVENYFNKVLMPELSQAKGDEAKDRVVSFSGSIGIIPFSVQSNLRAQMMSTNPKVAANAADTINRFQIAHPQLLTTMSQSDLAFAKMVSGSIEAGVPAEQAITDGRKVAFGMTDVEKSAFNKTYREEKFDESNVSHLKNTDFVDPDPLGVGVFGFLRGGARIPPKLVNDYNLLVKSNYLLTGGNIDMARSLADKQIQQRWGITETGGDRRMMRFAPETVYKRIDPDTSWIKTQFGGMTKSTVEKLDKATKDRWKLILGRDMEASDLTIQSDAITIRERIPGYAIVFPDGTHLMNNTGEVLRYYPDYQNTEQFAKRSKEAEFELEQRDYERNRAEILRGLRQNNPDFRKARKITRSVAGEGLTSAVENILLSKKTGLSPKIKQQIEEIGDSDMCIDLGRLDD